MKDNIIRNPQKKYPITFVTVVFVFILVYFVTQGAILSRRSSINAYNIGAVTSDSVYSTRKGIILRDETVYRASVSGYVTYYAVAGDRVSKESLICTLEKASDSEEKLHELYYGQEILTQESRLKVQEMIRTAASAYDPMKFSTASKAKTDIRSTIFHALVSDGGEAVIRNNDADYTKVESDDAGFALFYADGYEGMAAEMLYKEAFDENLYSLEQRYSGDHVENGGFIYKLAKDNKFSVAFLLDEADRVRFQQKTRLSIRFPDDRELTGDFRISETADGASIGIVSFQKYGGNYLEDRFINFMILDKGVTGYKIPESAITTKSFFAVGNDYIIDSGSQKGVMVKKSIGESFVPCTVYQNTADDSSAGFIIGDDTSYIFSEALSTGDVIIGESDASGEVSRTEMKLGVRASVEGVFQINQGYCIFKPIVRLNDSLETSYVMIEPFVRYGLQAYDRIVLNASEVQENELIFE